MTLLPATGPMWNPATPSVHTGPGPCACDPTLGESCDRCSGVQEDAWADRKASPWSRLIGMPLTGEERRRAAAWTAAYLARHDRREAS